MSIKFMGKTSRTKIIRPMLNRVFQKNITKFEEEKKTGEEILKVSRDLQEKTEKESENITEKPTKAPRKTRVKKENKELNESKMDDRLEKIEGIVNAKAPKRKVKVEKKERGLIERTQNSTILLTEDNKMLLND